jgi:hypothetical protein
MTTQTINRINEYRRPDGRFGDQPKSRPPLNEEQQARVTAISEGAAVPAGYARVNEQNVNQWWATAHTVREWGTPDQASYPTLDDTMHSTADGRRMPRITYQGNGFTLTMLSATEHRRMASELGGGTFQTMVSATNEEGRDITLPMLCTQRSTGWTVTPVTASANADRVAEAMSAVLEARHPRQAITQAGDLMAARRERIQAGQAVTVQTPGKDTWINGVGVSDDGLVVVTIPNKKHAETRVYGYQKMFTTQEERDRFWRRLSGATEHGVGKVYNDEVKPAEGVQVTMCPQCQMVHRVDHVHKCFAHQARPVRGESGRESGLRARLARLWG